MLKQKNHTFVVVTAIALLIFLFKGHKGKIPIYGKFLQR